MSERTISVALTVFLLVVVSIMAWMALDFNEQARRLPLAVGLPTIAFLVLQLVREILAFRLGPEISDATEGEDATNVEDVTMGTATSGVDEATSGAVAAARGPSALVTEAGPDRSGRANRTTAVQAFAWVLALGVTFYVFGMMLTVPVFMGLFMRAYGRESWKTIASVVVVAVVILYTFFVRLLEVQLYSGIIGEWLGL